MMVRKLVNVNIHSYKRCDYPAVYSDGLAKWEMAKDAIKKKNYFDWYPGNVYITTSQFDCGRFFYHQGKFIGDDQEFNHLKIAETKKDWDNWYLKYEMIVATTNTYLIDKGVPEVPPNLISLIIKNYHTEREIKYLLGHFELGAACCINGVHASYCIESCKKMTDVYRPITTENGLFQFDFIPADFTVNDLIRAMKIGDRHSDDRVKQNKQFIEFLSRSVE